MKLCYHRINRSFRRKWLIISTTIYRRSGNHEINSWLISLHEQWTHDTCMLSRKAQLNAGFCKSINKKAEYVFWVENIVIGIRNVLDLTVYLNSPQITKKVHVTL